MKLHKKLNKSECDFIIEKFKYLSKHKGVSERRPGDVRIFGFERYIDKSISNKIFKIDSDYYYETCGVRPIYQTLMVNHTYFATNSRGSGDGWHRDSVLEPQHKTIFYLVDVDSCNGPFAYFDKCFMSDVFFRFIRRVPDSLAFILSVFCKPVILSNKSSGFGFSACTNNIHRGLPVTSGERFAITCYSYLKNPSKHIQKIASIELNDK